MQPTLVIMAAGIGSRYGGCKQIDPIGPGGEIIIDYSVYDAIQAGFGKLVLILSRAIESDFREQIGRRLEAQIDTHYVIQELTDLPKPFAPPADRVKPWGTGHAVLVCKDVVKEPFAVINADDFYGRTTYAVLADYLSNDVAVDDHDYALVAFRLGNTLSDHGTVARGICRVDAEANLAGVRECLKIERRPDGGRQLEDDGSFTAFTGDEPASMNFWGFTPAVFEQLESRFGAFLENNIENLTSEYLLPEIMDALVNCGDARLKVLHSDETWHGVTYQPDKPILVKAVSDMVTAGTYPKHLS
jgi:hypothetical protein